MSTPRDLNPRRAAVAARLIWPQCREHMPAGEWSAWLGVEILRPARSWRGLHRVSSRGNDASLPVGATPPVFSSGV